MRCAVLCCAVPLRCVPASPSLPSRPLRPSQLPWRSLQTPHHPIPLIHSPLSAAAGASVTDHLLTRYRLSMVAVLGAQFSSKCIEQGREGVLRLTKQQGGWYVWDAFFNDRGWGVRRAAGAPQVFSRLANASMLLLGAPCPLQARQLCCRRQAWPRTRWTCCSSRAGRPIGSCGAACARALL